MILIEQKETTPQPAHEFRVSKGNFVAVVQAYENRYKFLVRDERREGPTIHGCGADFPHALMSVNQLMDALTHQP